MNVDGHPLDQSAEVLREIIDEIRDNRRMLVLMVAMIGCRPFTRKYLSQKTGWSTTHLAAPLKKMINMGLVVRTHRNSYVLVGNPSPAMVSKAVRIINTDVTLPTQDIRHTVTEVPLPEPPPPPPAPDPVDPPPPDASPTALKLAKMFGVVPKRPEGEAHLRNVEPCTLCGRPSPLHYGGVPFCYTCSRPGGK